ncbi:hypothetical protein [Streptomyces sp. 1-11]|uniref:hypothetical protein n=1 Tax=Streptomyces sp. 1-11 TaxID=2590549 RepID=UPI00117092B0|nr:hypothetical protein [Streptomyces sp. 1-11]GEK04504.1 hypothetical protein TNCT1_67800 [Streptomyces sp. 1-11]
MTSLDRYYLLLVCDGRPVLRGWWGTEAVARRKFRVWVGEYGSMPGARITLLDEERTALLATCPDQQELAGRRVLMGVAHGLLHGLLDLVPVRLHRFRVCRDGRLHGVGRFAPAPQLGVEIVTGEAGESRTLLFGGSFQLDQLIGDLCHSTGA